MSEGGGYPAGLFSDEMLVGAVLLGLGGPHVTEELTGSVCGAGGSVLCPCGCSSDRW